MDLTIFGGSGTTGILLIEKALSKGYKVTAYARTPSKITIQNPNLNIVKGNLNEITKIEKAIGSADAVISLLGSNEKSKGLEISIGIQNIVTAMKN